MQEHLAALDKMVQEIHKREPSMKVYECYALSIELLKLSEMTKQSYILEYLTYEKVFVTKPEE